MDWITMHLRSYTPRAHKRKMSVEGHSARVVAHSALWAHSAQVVAPQTVAGRAAGINCVKNETRSHETYKGTYGPSSLSSTLEVGW